MQSIQNNQYLILNNIIYDETTREVTMFFDYNGKKIVISGEITISGSGNDVIRGIASEGLSNLAMDLISIKNGRSYLNKLFETVINYCDSKFINKFPVVIMQIDN
jgi:hypothetical protein